MRKYRVVTVDKFIIEIECACLEFSDGGFRFMHEPDIPIAIINKDFIQTIIDLAYDGHVSVVGRVNDS